MTLLGTNISSPKGTFESMIFLFRRCDMWSLPWRVINYNSGHKISYPNRGHYQPKQCTIAREIPQNYHTHLHHVWSPKEIGNLMTPAIVGPLFSAQIQVTEGFSVVVHFGLLGNTREVWYPFWVVVKSLFKVQGYKFRMWNKGSPRTQKQTASWKNQMCPVWIMWGLVKILGSSNGHS